MKRRMSRWVVLGVVAIAPALAGADGRGCSPHPTGTGGTGGGPGGQCRDDKGCAVPLICKVCPDGSCANPNVHCVNGTCTPPKYTCPAPDASTEPQCKADSDCPVLAICRLCPDGSCANPNVHCVKGTCS